MDGEETYKFTSECETRNTQIVKFMDTEHKNG